MTYPPGSPRPIICPCCGQAMTVERPDYLLLLPMPPAAWKVLQRAVKAWPSPVDMGLMVDWVYGDDPNGGPLSAIKSIHVAAYRVRKAVASQGWTLRSRYGRGFVLERAP